MLDWMNSGPGPLDLLTPLSEGVNAGQHQQQITNQKDYQTGELANEAAKTDLMKQQLGFQRDMWTSQADMRTAQLSLMTSQAADASVKAQNVASDHAALGPWQDTLGAAAAKGDFTTILNAPLPSLTTPEAMQAAETYRNNLLQTGAGKAAAAVQNANLAIQMQTFTTQADQMKQLAAVPNANINNFYTTDANGQKVWDQGKAAAAIQANDIAVKATEAQNSATVLNATIKAQSSRDVADTRAGATMTDNRNTNSTKLLQTKILARQKAVASGSLPQADADRLNALDQQELQASQAAGGDGSVSVGGTAVEPLTPAASPAARASQYINSVITAPPGGQ